MNDNTIGILINSIVAIIVAIISATIMRVKKDNREQFDIGDAFFSLIFGVVWPLTIVAGVVYLASDFLCRKFSKAREEN